VHIGSKRTKAKHIVITKKHIVSHMHRFQPNKKITTMSLLKKHIVSHMHRSQPNKKITYCHSILFVIIAVLRPLWGPCGAYSQSLPTEDDRSRHPSVEDNRRSQCWFFKRGSIAVVSACRRNEVCLLFEGLEHLLQYVVYSSTSTSPTHTSTHQTNRFDA